LSPSSSCRLTTLPVRLSIFFCASVDGGQALHHVDESLVGLLEALVEAQVDFARDLVRRWSILTESRSLESARFLRGGRLLREPF